MSRIEACVNTCKVNDRTVFTSFITAGDPNLSLTVPALHALVAGGVDVLEIGVPFSDPEAEGPSIQRSSERALANGVNLHRTLDLVESFREENSNTPVVLMGYLNTFLAMGAERFASVAQAKGVDGVIIVNLPPESAVELKCALSARGIDLIFLIAPTTTLDRSKKILEHASGFVYFVSLKGITGSDHFAIDRVQSQLVDLKSLTELPIFIGFGIKTPEAAVQAANFADGIVVGSAIVDTMALDASAALILDAIQEQASGFRSALDK